MAAKNLNPKRNIHKNFVATSNPWAMPSKYISHYFTLEVRDGDNLLFKKGPLQRDGTNFGP